MAPIRWTSAHSPAHRSAKLTLARAAAAAHPERAELHLLFARELAAAGEAGEALRVLEKACGLFPEHEPLHDARARALAEAGRLDAALSGLRGRARSPRAALTALQLLRRHGRLEEAAAFEAAVAAVLPADADLLECRAARLHDDPAGLLKASEEVLAHEPAAAHGLYYKAVALAQLGRGREAAALMALDRFVDRRPLPTPAGFDSSEAFRAAVAAEIRANPTLHADPVGYATRKGLRTGTFPAEGDRASVALVAALRREVQLYAEGLAGDHPFVAARPVQARFTPWALLLRGEGHQRLHYHPGRWLTGVCYLDAPRGGAGCGALRIGVLPEWAGVEPPWEVMEVEPVPGRLVLFPSYVPHATQPTGSDSERISVAFDVADSGSR